VEVILLHKTSSKREAKDRTVEMLTKVGIPDPSQRRTEYPYQLS